MPNVVNLAKRTPATHMLVVRHRDRPGVLAHVFDHLREANLNVQETENIVFEGAEAAVARINLDGAPPSRRSAQDQGGRTGRPRSPSSSTAKGQLRGPATACVRTEHFSTRAPFTDNQRNTHSTSPPVRPSCRSRCSNRSSAICSRCPASACRSSRSAIARSRSTSHRGLRSRSAKARRHSRRLPRAVPAGRREPAVLDGADEPAAGRRLGRLHRHRRLVEKAVKEAKRVGAVKIAASTEADKFTRVPSRAS